MLEKGFRLVFSAEAFQCMFIAEGNKCKACGFCGRLLFNNQYFGDSAGSIVFNKHNFLFVDLETVQRTMVQLYISTPHGIFNLYSSIFYLFLFVLARLTLKRP